MIDPLREQLQNALAPALVIARELGGGGMSRVFLADEPALGRKLVVKVLAPELAAGVNVDRFRREIQLAAGLQHPHIVPVIAAGEVPDGEGHGRLPYFTMPYVAGDSLRARIEREGALPIADIVGILRDVARGLAYAHAAGVVHRDIKPDNILLSAGTATVTDFGVAKALSTARRDAGDERLTVVGMSLGTPAYMAPEQAAGDPDTDHRADLYALGVVAYEMITGVTPFGKRSAPALLAAQLTEQPAPVAVKRRDVPPALAALVMHALKKNPAERVQSADEFLAELDGVHSGAARPGPRVIAAVAGAVLVLVLAAWWLGGAGGGGSSGSDLQAIAVLPLVNTGGDPDDEYFSDGMTDELAGALTRVPGLRVASRTSSYAFKGVRDVDVREIGRRLGVGAVLEGTVRRQGSRLRLAAQLTNTADGLTLWSNTYEREVDDVFEVQDELAGAIVTALAPRLTGDTARVPRIAAPPTEDLEAYDLYLRGRYHWHQRGEDALRRAAELFEQAIERDPGYAEAHAGLADALALIPVYGDTPGDSVLPRARAEAERAVALDSTLSDAHATLGLVLKTTGDWAGAERSLRRALALDSTAAPTYQWIGEVLVITGRFGEAAAALQRAHRLDPLSPIIAAELGYMLTLAGQPDSGIAAGRRATALAPDLWAGYAFLGSSYTFQNRMAEAIPLLQRAVQLDPAVSLFRGVLAYAYARAGRAAEARTVVEELEREAAAGGSPTPLAVAYVGLNEPGRALDQLEAAAAQRDPYLLQMSLTPTWFDPIRAEPRFAAVARAIGLDPSVMRRPTGR